MFQTMRTRTSLNANCCTKLPRDALVTSSSTRPDMVRRHLLGALAVIPLAGCTGAPSESTATDTSSVQAPSAVKVLWYSRPSHGAAPSGETSVQVIPSKLQTSLKYLRPEADMSRSPESAFSTWGSATRAKPFLTPLPTTKLEAASQGADDFKNRSVPSRSGEQLPNGDFVSGSRLGRHFVRKRGSSRWQPVDVGVWGEVLSVRRHGDGLLVAGEDGLLRSSTDEGSSWKDLPPPGPGLIRVAQALRDGRVVALVRNAAQWSVWWPLKAKVAFERVGGGL